LQWGGGGGVNVTIDGPINMNGANSAIQINPTGTGSVSIAPAGALTVNKKALTITANGDTKTYGDVKTYGSSNQLQVTTDYMVDDKSLAADSIVSSKVVTELTKLTGKTPEIISSDKVEATVAQDIKDSALLSVIFSLVIMFAYLLIRFRRWQYGVGAVAALAYVVLFIMSIFSILNGILPFSLDIDQAFIAAILTVVGYSINDTVVIFDRIREYLGQHGSKSEDMATVINNALNSTLSRTVVTGLTTIGVLIILFFFGGEVIRGFSFAMLIGVVVGTYTSLFVASPVVVDLFRRTNRLEAEKAEATKA
jgi:SecD/SecF fusion protein